jgi:hypothetical protein
LIGLRFDEESVLGVETGFPDRCIRRKAEHGDDVASFVAFHTPFVLTRERVEGDATQMSAYAGNTSSAERLFSNDVGLVLGRKVAAR